MILRIQHDGVWEDLVTQNYGFTISTDSIPEPVISYPELSYTLTEGIEISPIIPVNTGGVAVDWEVTSGNLPEGLSLSPVDGSTRARQLTQWPASVTIGATNSGGTDYATISFTVNQRVPDIDYPSSEYTFTKDSLISDIIPSNSGGDASSWTITSGSIPNGLLLDSSTGVISGTPTIVLDLTPITIQASNSAGSDTQIISMTVIDIIPEISYPENPLRLTMSHYRYQSSK